MSELIKINDQVNYCLETNYSNININKKCYHENCERITYNLSPYENNNYCNEHFYDLISKYD